ncbi:hypothetical protein AB0I89_24120 [Micromonospora sp. NPDC049801]|uniref:hypothetical protein n=1 Tax=unclassified Micromonospora TaxID=2617518 RepID=UPI0033CE58D2
MGGMNIEQATELVALADRLHDAVGDVYRDTDLLDWYPAVGEAFVAYRTAARRVDAENVAPAAPKAGA